MGKKMSYMFGASLFVDISFIIYWFLIWVDIVPEEYMFKNYRNPILQDWNWSFLPLDLLVSAFGCLAFFFWRNGNGLWRLSMIISMSFMFCAGLQAISFWWIRSDFDPIWWLMNLFLMLIPIATLTVSVAAQQKDGRNV